MVTPTKLMDGNVNKSFASKYCLLASTSVRIAQKSLVKYFSFSGKVKYRASLTTSFFKKYGFLKSIDVSPSVPVCHTETETIP